MKVLVGVFLQLTCTTKKNISSATTLVLLNRRTRHITITTIHATITIFGLQDGFAMLTIVKELASIRGHGFCFLMATLRASNFGLQNESFHFTKVLCFTTL
jgi:hypothetical protein